jgi:hypothetical protein
MQNAHLHKWGIKPPNTQSPLSYPERKHKEAHKKRISGKQTITRNEPNEQMMMAMLNSNYNNAIQNSSIHQD